MPAPVPVILGPTASGKTSVGLHLARLLNGEIISVDSRKIYRGLPVGTATPDGVWKNGVFLVDGVPHHLTAFLEPDQPYAAGDFAEDADRLVSEIRGRGRVPILVGGTGFYFKALQQGLPGVPASDPAVRAALEKRLAAEGLAALHAELAQRDPEGGRTVRLSDRNKVLRALEVLIVSGRPFSSFRDAPRTPSPHRFVVMGIDLPKDALDRRIEARSKEMAEGGMIEETAAVLARGFAPDCPALASFGYREAVDVVQGRLDRAAFLPLLIKGTRAYAKRQRTWFRTQVRPAWFAAASETSSEISMRMKAFYEGCQT